MIQAVLFDFDGVVASTIEIHIDAWRTVWKEYYNLEPDPLVVKKNEGSPAFRIAQELGDHLGHPLSAGVAKKLSDEKNLLFRQNIHDAVYPDSGRVLQEIKNRGLYTGLVTGTQIENVLHVLDSEIVKLFDTIVTEKDTSNGKPAPDPYLAAMKKLNVPAKNCLVIENAPLGISAAVASGAHTVALETTLPKDYLREADWILSDHKALYEFVRFLNPLA